MTRDVSDQYQGWAQGGAESAAFGSDSPYGGDHEAVRSGRIDPGRWELHQHVEAELAATGSTDYEGALTRVLAQAQTGVIALSQAALAGTGVEPSATRAGRGGVRHDMSGRVVTLSGGPVQAPAPGPLDDPRDARRFDDAMAYCANRDSTLPLLKRCNFNTAEAQIDAWAQAGGAGVAGVRTLAQPW